MWAFSDFMGFPVVIISVALGATRPRDKTDLHLWLSQVDALDGHAIVANHGRLQTAAEAVAVDSGHQRLGSSLHLIQELGHHKGLLVNIIPIFYGL